MTMLRRLLDLLPTETLHGYEHPELVETIFRKTLAYEPTEPWPEIEGAKTVLDFGGGCGLHYKEARLPSVRWAVVETPAMVGRAKELETDQLRFFTDISKAADWLGSVDVMHSNGTLQYTTDPVSTLNQLCSIGARRMLWYRTFLADEQSTETKVSRLADNGPGQVKAKRKKVSYTATLIPERDFLAAHHAYKLEERGEDWFRFVI